MYLRDMIVIVYCIYVCDYGVGFILIIYIKKKCCFVILDYSFSVLIIMCLLVLRFIGVKLRIRESEIMV